MTHIAWVDAVVVTALVVGSLWTIWRKAIRPSIRAVNRLADTITVANQLLDDAPVLAAIAEVAPALQDIAAEFRPNHGGSLRDVVDSIDRKADTAAAAATDARTEAVHAAAIADETRTLAASAATNAAVASGMAEDTAIEVIALRQRLDAHLAAEEERSNPPPDV